MAGTDDERRFYELAWPHMDAVLRTAQCLTRGGADADDLAQETMFKAFKAIRTIRDAACAKAWLMSILRRSRIDQVRADRGEVNLNPSEFEPARDDAGAESDRVRPGRQPDAALDTLDDEEVVRALRELPREIRWTLLLVDVEGMGQHDAAVVLGIPTGTVKSRLHRGRAMLRQTLGRGEAVVRKAAPSGRSPALVGRRTHRSRAYRSSAASSNATGFGPRGMGHLRAEHIADPGKAQYQKRTYRSGH